MAGGVPGAWAARDARLGRLLAAVWERPLVAALVVVLLAMASFVPGQRSIPPVDRTEIIYADTSRGMLERGDVLTPIYRGEREKHRPIGTFWIQMASVAAQGEASRAEIAAYRLPSLLSALLAVAIVTVMLRRPAGGAVAFVAGALLAAMPVLAVQAHLAITEAVLLAPMMAAQMALLRLYVAGDGEATGRLALLLWCAQGVSILLNALAVPILSASTLIALAILDRDIAWWRRLRPAWGLPLMAAIGAPWIIIQASNDGGWPYPGMSLGQVLAAIGGAQAMKFRAMPATFTVGLILGTLPATLLLWPALRDGWKERVSALPRFLVCWLVGYLAYLELISSKPALYSVQAILPPAAALVARLIVPTTAGEPWRMPQVGRAGLAGAGMFSFLAVPGAFVAVHALTGSWPSPASLGLLGVVLGAFAVALMAARERLGAVWLTASLAAMAAFHALVFGLTLPRLEKVWVAPLIAEALAPLKSCVSGPPQLVGFKEPSATFVLGGDAVLAQPEDVAASASAGGRRVVVVERGWHDLTLEAMAAKGQTLAPRVACVAALNVMRGCRHEFSVHVIGDGGGACTPPARFACTTELPAVSRGSRPPRGCD